MKKIIYTEDIVDIVKSNFKQLIDLTDYDQTKILNSIYNRYNKEDRFIKINENMSNIVDQVSELWIGGGKHDWVCSSIWGIHTSIADVGKSGIPLNINIEQYRILRDFLRITNKKLVYRQVDEYVNRFNDGYTSSSMYSLEPTGDLLLDLKQIKKDFNWCYNISAGTSEWFEKVKILITEIDMEINKLQA